MRKLRWALLPFAAGLLALAVACSGGDDDSSDDGATTGGSSVSGGGGTVSQELNLAQAANRLMELRSFRFDLALNLDFDIESLEAATGDDGDQFGAAMAAMFLALFQDISVSGAYVAPDSFDVEATFAGEKARYIQIGNEAWENDGSGWTETTPNGGDLSLFLGDPSEFSVDMLPDAVLTNAEISEEEVNGQTATRYHYDKAALEAMAAELGEDTSEFGEIDELSLDIWLVDGSLPVKFEIEGSFTDPESGDIGLSASFEISDINADINIERPIP